MQTSPFVRFNKDGMLLAVSIHANGIKILANPDGVRLLRTTENRSLDASGVAFASVAKVKTFLNPFIYNSDYSVRILSCSPRFKYVICT